MNRNLLLLLFVIFPSILFTQVNSKKHYYDASLKISKPKSYYVKHIKTALEIDGKDDDLAWDIAPFSDSFIDIEGEKTPKFNTKVKMLWDNMYLYVYARLEEEHIWGDIYERDQIIYYNNDFEVFIDPAGNGAPYGEIEINALNTVWDLLLDKPYRTGGQAIFEWNLEKLKTAVYIEGTLNKPGDIDSFWSVEMAIPIKSIAALRSSKELIPKLGDHWRINFSRVNWEHELIDGVYRKKKRENRLLPEKNWVWSPQHVVNMHEPERWGYLIFIEEKEFVEKPEHHYRYWQYKQGLFALFRACLYNEIKWQLLSTGDEILINTKLSKEMKPEARLRRTFFGYEIEMNVSDGSGKFIINQDGKLKFIE